MRLEKRERHQREQNENTEFVISEQTIDLRRTVFCFQLWPVRCDVKEGPKNVIHNVPYKKSPQRFLLVLFTVNRLVT